MDYLVERLQKYHMLDKDYIDIQYLKSEHIGTIKNK